MADAEEPAAPAEAEPEAAAAAAPAGAAVDALAADAADAPAAAAADGAVAEEESAPINASKLSAGGQGALTAAKMAMQNLDKMIAHMREKNRQVRLQMEEDAKEIAWLDKECATEQAKLDKVLAGYEEHKHARDTIETNLAKCKEGLDAVLALGKGEIKAYGQRDTRLRRTTYTHKT